MGEQLIDSARFHTAVRITAQQQEHEALQLQLVNPGATASFQHFIMPMVHNLHQSLFGNRPSTASHGSGRHDHRADRLYSNLPLAPLPSDSLIEVSLAPLAPRLANA